MSKIIITKEKDNQIGLEITETSNKDVANAIIALANYMVQDNRDATGIDVIEQIWAKMVDEEL